MNKLMAAISMLLLGGSALAVEPTAPLNDAAPSAEVASKCQEIVGNEALSEADRQLYFNACVAELTAYEQRRGNPSI